MRKLAAAILMAAPAMLVAQVIGLDKTPQAKVRPVPVREVTLGEGFWSARLRTNVDKSIPTLLALLEEHGIIDNFRRLSGRKAVARRGPLYTDSDLYKWIEAAAFTLESKDNAALRATIDRIVDDILAAQEPSGYLNTYYVDDRVRLRFTEMQRSHELYCLGHLLQAGIAYFRATGNRRLLDGGIRFADYLAANFGPKPKRPLLTGHPELEMALVELYRTTGERKYLELAGYLLSGVERERLKLREGDLRYLFSGKPFVSRTGFEGHAVRAMYASCGAADYYAETGEAAYGETLKRLWQDMRQRKMYLTGGVGSRSEGEAFGEPYELPNTQAYTESCAAIANLMWNFRMLAITGESRFTDVMERALYNGINSGMSLEGTLYCYRNPLASDGEKIRNPWYDTTCCPPNLQRMLASLPGYLYGAGADGSWYVHLYHASEMRSASGVKLKQETQYPWSGRVDITVTPAAQASTFTLYLRIPEWSRRTTVSVNGKPLGQAVTAGSYLPVSRAWKPGDTVRLELDTAIRLTAANPRVPEGWGKVAVERGPLVYCLEQPDQAESVDVGDALIAESRKFTAGTRNDSLGGALTIVHQGLVYSKPLSDAPLYAEVGELPARKAASLTFIPYYAWANRGPSRMRVWIPVAKE
jgi:uncharacterized protein